MYKLIIVDDEFGAAKAMSNFIDYEEFDFTVEGVFASAEQALEFIKENNVDLIISDIKMRGMTGIELLKAVNERFPRIKVVLISAYRDFEYAKEAVSNSAFYYITKPISYSEFTEVLVKVKKAFEKRENVAISDVDAVSEMQRKIIGYFNGNIDMPEHSENHEEHKTDIDITNGRCSVININIPDIAYFFASKWKHGSEKFFYAIKQIIPINMNEIIFSVLSSEKSGIRIIAVDIDSSKDYKRRIDAFISQVNYEIFMVFGLNVDISVTSTANSLRELKSSNVNTDSQVLKMMMYYINRKETDKLADLLEEFFKLKSIDDCRRLCNLITNEAAQYGAADDEINIDEAVMQCIDSIEILNDYARVMLNKLGASFAESRQNTILRVISYIGSRYAEDLSLNSMAGHIGLTAAYISHYFKKEMKQTYSDFIVKVRIENAKKLLINEPDLKISNIVAMVGYESEPYFYKAFRKYAGCLPGEYRSKER